MRGHVCLGLIGACAGAAAGQVVTVTTLNDIVDFGGAKQVADLPGPDGEVSFREAVTATNNTPGAQTIEFAIPEEEWWLLEDTALLRLEEGLFLVSGDETTIDFASQADNVGGQVGIYGLEPNGIGTAAILISGDNCTVIGLGPVFQRGYGVEISGNDNRVIGCNITGPIHDAVNVEGSFGGPAATGNVIGGTEPGEGNFLSGGGRGGAHRRMGE